MSLGLSVIDLTHSGAVLVRAHSLNWGSGRPRVFCKREAAEGTA